jgi:hypothetical protein
MERVIKQDDLEAAQRGLNMIAMSVADLETLMAEHHPVSPMFASRVIHAAAKQMRAVKLATGARRE